jgi:hypothetical protein
MPSVLTILARRMKRPTGSDRHALGLDDLGAADEAADRVGEEQVPIQIGRIAIAADDLGPGGGREVAQAAGGHAHARQSALHVADAGGRVRDLETGLPLIVREQRAVLDRNLEVGGPALAGRIHQPDLPVVVHRHAPFGAGRARGLAQDAGRRPPETERVVRAVDPVVERPDEAALRLLHVPAPARADTGVEDLAPVGDAVAVRVHQQDDVIRVRLVGDDALVERQDHAREEQVVGEDGVAIVDAVFLRALVHADAACRFVLPAGVDVEHIAAELGDVEPAVSVERHHCRADDRRIRKHQFQSIPRRKDEAFRLLFRRERKDRRLRTVVPAGVGRIGEAGTTGARARRRRAAAALAAALRAAPAGCLAAALRTDDLCQAQHQRDRADEREPETRNPGVWPSLRHTLPLSKSRGRIGNDAAGSEESA